MLEAGPRIPTPVSSATTNSLPSSNSAGPTRAGQPATGPPQHCHPKRRPGWSKASAARRCTGTAWPTASRTGNFSARSEYGEIDGANLADWPLAAKRPVAVLRRSREAHGRDRHPRHPGAHPPNNNFKLLAAGARLAGYRQISNARQAINSEPRDGRPGCLQIGFCNQGCRIDAKWTVANSFLRQAEAGGRLDLRTGCMVTQITHDKNGKVDAVVYRDSEGVEQRQRARVVCVAGNSIETPRLLLNSASAQFPDGLANSSGQVGRNYMHHVAALAFGVFRQAGEHASRHHGTGQRVRRAGPRPRRAALPAVT